MGRTIPSYRLASERERRQWKILQIEKSELEKLTADVADLKKMMKHKR